MVMNVVSKPALSEQLAAQKPVPKEAVIPASVVASPAETKALSIQPAATERQRLDSAVAKLNDYVQVVRRELQFSVHDDSGRTVVKVLDRDTGDLVRQMPSEEMLSVADHLPGDFDGEQDPVLFNDRA